ncbi:MAG: WD40/YVTN/BNR-like repeat-containing protein [Gammaproteobacteria bacterium]
MTLVAALLTTGCEAPLVLDHVEAQREATTQRFDLFQAAAGNGKTIVVVGNAGVVLTSNDDGSTWQRAQLAGAPFLLDITTCADDRFVSLAAERQIWIADADAQNWNMLPLDTFEAVQAITCDPRGNIWVVGSFSTIWKSADDGASWTESSMDEDLHFTSIQFVDDDIGFMTGEFGDIVRTQDGGDTWEFLAPLPDEFYPQAAHFQDSTTGWIVGLNGTIWATEDGAQTWARQESGTTAPLYGIATNDTELFIVGGFGTLLTSSQADTWTRVDHGQPIRFYLRGLLPLRDDRVLVAGGAGALLVVET